MFQLKGICLLAPMILLGAVTLHAEPYWVAYEGDVFPEEDGWKHIYGEDDWPPEVFAERSVEDGVFTLDTLHDSTIFDHYTQPLSIAPGPDEVFVAEWRLRVDPASDPYDISIVIARPGIPGHVDFLFAPEGVYVQFWEAYIEVAPAVYHSYQLVSSDMDSYSFYVDGELRYSSDFEDVTLLEGFISFGDGAINQRSSAEWDYFRFGVVPEPASQFGAMLFLAISRTVVRYAQARRR